MDSKIKIKIGWSKPITFKKYGGVVYENQLRKILAEKADLDLVDIRTGNFKNKYLKALTFLFNLFKLKGEKDLWIRDFYTTVALSLRRTKGKNLVIIHHLDFSGFPLIAKPFLNLLKIFFFYPNLRKTDVIVVVSEYWKNYLVKKGYQDIYKIYNSFDLSDFYISDKEVLEFKNKHNLVDKPIIYLGNCQKAKGVKKSLKALDGINAYLVTSGEPKVKINALNLNLEDRDYLKLLKSCSVVVAMSEFEEGWCRTAHEAMLLKTPVIGSGLGGMQELLVGGKQIVCRDFKDLKTKVQDLLNHPYLRDEMGEYGYNFAKEFTLERFEREWLNLIEEILNKNNQIR